MGSDQVLAALLHRCRAALRLDGTGVLAGHGIADNAYRPPHLPYASVIGPLALETEPERNVAAQVVRVRNPGYLAGVPRSAADSVPAAGVLGLEFDGSARAVVPVDPGPLIGLSITTGDTAARLAAIVQAAIRAAVDGGTVTAAGVPVTDPVRLSELRMVTVRWDRQLSRFVISSGRRGPLSGDLQLGIVSQVTHLPQAVGDLAGPLGLAAGALAAPGSITRSRDSAPTAVAIDVRVDLWAATQSQLATLLDAWSAVTPTRAELLLSPTQLAADVQLGDTTVRLLFDALPRTAATLLATQTADGWVDRITGRPAELAAGAALDPSGLRLAGTATATYLVIPAPAIASAWQPQPPGARGWAVELRLRAEPGATVGTRRQVFQLRYGTGTCLRLELIRDVGDYRLEGTAQRGDGGSFAPAVVTLAPAILEGADPVSVCVLVDAATGAVRLVAEGARAGPDAAPAPGPSLTGVDEDLVLTLGEPGAPGTDLEIVISEASLHGRPLGPADSRLRRPGPAATHFSPGDPLVLSPSVNGFSGPGNGFHGYVRSVDGAEVHLDRPVTETFRRGSSIAHQGRLFIAQRQLRRNDDLMNRLCRVVLEYRVSAFLDDTRSSVTAPLVERPEVELRELARLLAEQADPLDPSYPPRPGPARIGISTVITSSTASSTSSSGAGSSGVGGNQP